MLKICPKCGKFYDDADLRFCFLDGVFLIEAGENLRREGAEKVRLEKLFQKRKIFREKTNNFLIISITSVLVIMIFSVVVINSWLYFNPENETVENKTPLQTPNIENLPTPNVKKTVLSTPEKTKTPKIENKENDAPQSCSAEEKQKIETEIIKKFEKDWLDEARKDQEKVRKEQIEKLKNQCDKSQNVFECRKFSENTKVEFLEKTVNPSISSTDCKTAIVNVSFEWKSSRSGNFVTPKNFEYRKIENNWVKN